MAFNETFKAFGYNFEWGIEEYHELLRIAGGKERMRHYLHTKGFGVEVKPEEEDDLIAELHRHKTEAFIRLIEAGRLPLRPGVKRLMREINQAGLVLGICTTSNQRAAHAVAYESLKGIQLDFVLAGDVVKKKKPDPIVIEDSENGVMAAHSAGMHIVATTNFYTEHENLSLADIVVTSLGDPEGERGVLKAGGKGLDYDGVLLAEQLVRYFSR